MNRAQRMQLKAFICVLGFLLILVLLLGKLILALVHMGEDEEGEQVTPPHVPVVQQFTNVWITEADEEGLSIFRDGNRERYSWGEEPAGEEEDAGEQAMYFPGSFVREQVADVELTDGKVTLVDCKTEKINGKVLSADSNGIEIEGYGRLPLAADYKGYRLYDSLEMCTAGNLCFGYDFTDFCLENGEICAILMAKEEIMEYIRVLVRTSGFGGIFHEKPQFTCDVDFTIVYGPYDNRKEEAHRAWEEITIDYDSGYFQSDRIQVIPNVLTGKVIFRSCERSHGIPSYRGWMEFLKTEEGIVAINEVLLEEYLYSVVPSEMPSSYPPEALRAQAICARTYAYGGMLHAGYPQYGAHVDDSTSYQVYNNIMEDENSTTAVKESYGQLLFTDAGKLAGTYYYSTSCGAGTDANVWKTEEAPTLTYLRPRALNKSAMANILSGGETEEDRSFGDSLREEENFDNFIRSVNEEDFERDEGWYRWTYESESVDKARLLEALQRRYAANSRHIQVWKDGEYVSEEIRELDEIEDMYIEKRGSGGVADELVIVTDSQKIKVISEYSIRYVLNDGKAAVMRQDGSQIASPTLLPSGFFVLTTVKEDGHVVKYSLTGGGFGHGVGMSQNGAKGMAGNGYLAEEILLYFYEGCSIKNIYE